VEFLLKSGADVNSSSKYGDTPLSLAARNHELNVATLLLRNNAKVNSRDDGGWTPLHKATSKCDLEMAELLLSNGANPNLKSTDTGGTPLHLAVECKKAMVELLITKGADAKLKNSNGDTALDLATDLADYYKHTNKDESQLQQVIEVLRRYTTSRDSPYRHAYSLVQ
jgi:ankyrin repeat protein